MRLNSRHKAIVMGNIELIHYCNRIGVNQAVFRKCNIEEMEDRYLFVLTKENAPKPGEYFMLDRDIETQPDVVLVMHVSNDGVITFEETKHTMRIL